VEKPGKPYIDSFPRFSTFDWPFVFVFCSPILTVSLVFPLLIALLSSSSVPLYWQFPSFFHFWLPFCLRLLCPYIDSFPRFSTFDCPFVFVFCTPILTVSLVFPLLFALLSSSSVPLSWQFPSDKRAIKSGKTRETVNIGVQKTKTKGQSKVEKRGKLSI
jgi:hypothetical protein